MCTIPSLSLALSLLAFAPVTPVASGQAALADLRSPELRVLDLPAGLPESFELDLVRDGGARRVELQRTDVRSSDFRVRVVGADGRYVDVAAPAPATYAGTVLGVPGSVVTASLLPIELGGLFAEVSEPGRAPWYVESAESLGLAAAAGTHVLYESPERRWSELCGAELSPPDPDEVTGAGGGTGGDCQRVAEIAFDVDFEYYTASGSSVPATIANVEAVMNVVTARYARDMLVTWEITEFIVRTAEPDPYSTAEAGPLLDALRNHWNDEQAEVPRDAAHLITGRNVIGNTIGLAYVGVVCNLPWAYGWSQFTFSFETHVNLLAHELGHNWDAPHCLDESGHIMCGNGLDEFGQTTVGVMMAWADGASCLDAGVPFPTAVPPRAREDDAVADAPTTIDVLANDHDGNCQPVAIVSFDASSALGGSIALSAGTGPNGRDELLYVPPLGGISGVDTFAYTIGDGTGAEDSTLVYVFDSDPSLIMRYRLDESGGPLMADSSGAGHLGVWSGLPGFEQPGAAPLSGTSVEFDGVDDYGLVNDQASLDQLTRNLTVAAWIRTDTTEDRHRVIGNDSSWAFGHTGDDLVFTTRRIKDYVVGTSLATDTWTHVAAVFDLDRDVRFFVDGLFVGEVEGTNEAGLPRDPWYVGALDFETELFDGRLDDVQVYDRALTDGQITCLYESATAPGLVFDSTVISLNQGGSQNLTLCAGFSGLEQHVYLLLGSGGSDPGFLLNGITVPLNVDGWFLYTLANPNVPPLRDTFGQLNPAGFAESGFELPAGSDPSLLGILLFHAYVVVHPATLELEYASEAVPLFLSF